MGKSTPGPWGVDDNHGKRFIEPIASNDPVAIVCKKSGPEYLANAHLIASAPELLAALERIYLETNESSIANIARAAADKARGES